MSHNFVSTFTYLIARPKLTSGKGTTIYFTRKGRIGVLESLNRDKRSKGSGKGKLFGSKMTFVPNIITFKKLKETENFTKFHSKS
jgi:hypothetical protein